MTTRFSLRATLVLASIVTTSLVYAHIGNAQATYAIGPTIVPPATVLLETPPAAAPMRVTIRPRGSNATWRCATPCRMTLAPGEYRLAARSSEGTLHRTIELVPGTLRLGLRAGGAGAGARGALMGFGAAAMVGGLVSMFVGAMLNTCFQTSVSFGDLGGGGGGDSCIGFTGHAGDGYVFGGAAVGLFGLGALIAGVIWQQSSRGTMDQLAARATHRSRWSVAVHPSAQGALATGGFTF